MICTKTVGVCNMYDIDTIFDFIKVNFKLKFVINQLKRIMNCYSN